MMFVRRFSFVAIFVLASLLNFAQNSKQIYELRVYELRFGGARGVLEKYFEKALFPTLNKYGIKDIGAFEEISKEDPAKLYLLIPYASMEAFGKTVERLETDTLFKELSKEFDFISADKTPYTRISSMLMSAFSGLPQLVKPKKSQKLFEVRTYESHNEAASFNKISMFNDEELKVFQQTGLHSVFFGQNIIGEHLPCLTYMLAFDSMEEREANWRKFGANPDWKRISSDVKYANNINKIRRVFLTPLPYSQL
ncbi:NIPSNAP family protein [Niabella ginsengisoli]|uniref:NIPSNAP family protein n=1 Tax=Niabella ginsengisoli TaxID=522298 RepID=A0ABS9SDL9_9BACT|nr:NIPSNAP family protein [Niabella ginsengisoli]MCH5596455.1 NIPSNAP family protein [Niabella ginsengisoli]